MKTEYSPPYRAHKSASGRWYVVNVKGGYEFWCECRQHAEVLASDLNEHADRERMRHAEFPHGIENTSRLP